MRAAPGILYWAPAAALALALLLTVPPAGCLTRGLADTPANLTLCNDPTCSSPCYPGLEPYRCPACRQHYRMDGGVCRPCKDPACVRCRDGADKCEECLGQYDFGPTYGLMADGTCRAPKCGFGCVACVTPRGGKLTCLGCIDGLTLVGGQCQPLPNFNAYCRYSLGKCFECPNPYVIGPGPPDAVGNRPRTCVLGVRNCATRQNVYKPDECVVCKTGYAPGQGTNDRGVVVGGCVRCVDPHCAACSYNSTICQACVDGYSPVNNTCVECPRGCGTCISRSRCKGSGCLRGYIYDGQGGCAPCGVSNCSVCRTKDTCHRCKDGFALVNGTCAACELANCMACDYGPSTCRVCQPGWGVTGGGRCVKCARTTGEPNCAACGLVSPTICEGCLDGGIAYFDTQGRRRCLPCKVKNCKHCFFSTICKECAPGYELQQNGTCIAA